MAATLLAPGALWARDPAPQGAPASAAGGEARISQWWARLQDGAQRATFQGTYVSSTGSTMSSAHILHVCQGPDQYERIDALDGQARRIHRHNKLVQTVWPATRTVLIEERELALAGFPAFSPATEQRVAAHYEVQFLRTERVAGHEADVVWLKPRDAARYGHRLWTARPSGLLLRSEVLDEAGEVLEWSAFSEVSIGGRIPLDQVMLGARQIAGYKLERSERTATDLQREGWLLRQGVPGFERVSCVRRPAEGEGPGLLQAIYSDGITHVSMFIEPFRPQSHRRELLLALGANRTLTMRHGEWWITVMGDVPVGTLRQFASGLERQP